MNEIVLARVGRARAKVAPGTWATNAMQSDRRDYESAPAGDFSFVSFGDEEETMKFLN